MLEDKNMPSNMAASTQYKLYYLSKKSKCHKISPLNVFPLKFRV